MSGPTMLRLNRLEAGLTCDACGHRLGDPAPPPPAEEDIASCIDRVLETIRTTFKREAGRRPIRERTLRDWSLLSDNSDLNDMTTLALAESLQAQLDDATLPSD